MRKTRKGNAKLSTIIGNGLITLSIIGFLVIFFPLIKEEFVFRTTEISTEVPISQNFSIRIPSQKINAPVISSVDPWDQNSYLRALEKGVAHAENSSLPNGEGTVYLFAHSSDYPWRMTRYNTAFFRLGRVKIGERITLTYKSNDYHYQVREKKSVWPNEVEYLTKSSGNQLILQTCTPIGTSLKRLLVFAEKENIKS